MARTAPVPNIPPIPGMCPSIAVMGGGGGGGGGSGSGAGGGDGSASGDGSGNGDGAPGDGSSSGSCGPGGTGACTNCGHNVSRGDPVNVVTGVVSTVPRVDAKLYGPTHLEFIRTYSTAARKRDTGLGFGWAHSFAWSIEARRDGLLLRRPTGETVEFPRIDNAGDSAMSRGGWRLRRDEDGFELDALDDFRHRFEEAGDGRYRLAWVADLADNRMTCKYRGTALEYIIDTAGRTLRFNPDAAGRLTEISVRDEAAQAWVTFARYVYDEHGDLVQVTDALGSSQRYQYEDHRLVRQTSPELLSFHYRYDPSGRCIETWGDYPPGGDLGLANSVGDLLADGTTRAKGILHCVFVWGEGGYSEVIDSVKVQRFFGNQFGTIDKAVSGGAVTIHQHDARGHVVAHEDALGAVTRFTRDDRGRLLSETNALGGTVLIERDAHGRVVKTTNQEGQVTRAEYDYESNVTLIEDPAGGITTFEYQKGLLTAKTDPNGSRTTFTSTPHGRLAEIRQPNGGVWRFEYNDQGYLTAQTTPLGATTRYAYDAALRLVSKSDEAGVTTYAYDREGRLIRITFPNGGWVEQSWGGFDSVVAIRRAMGENVRYRYNREGWLTEVHKDNGEVTRLEWNGRRELVRERTFDGREIGFRYDAMNRVVGFSDGARRWATLTRDPMGQVLEEAYPDGTALAFAYNQLGQVTHAKAPRSETTWARAKNGKVAREEHLIDGRSFVVHYEHDAVGEIVGLRTSLGHARALRRDAIGAVVRLDLDGEAFSFEVDAMGRERVRQLSGGGLLESEYDGRNQLVRRRARPVGSASVSVKDGDPMWVGPERTDTTYERTYAYNGVGDLIHEGDAQRGGRAYEVDVGGRLLRIEGKAGELEAFRYDDQQNMVRAGASARFGPGGRIAHKDGLDYVWDDAAHLQKRVRADGRAEVEYAWSARGTLSEVRHADGTTVRFLYDAFARRTQKQVSVQGPDGGQSVVRTTYFVWAGGNLVHEVTVSPEREERTRTYVFDERTKAPVAHRDGEDGGAARSRWLSYALDPVDAPTALLRPDGRVDSTIAQDAYGKSAEPRPTPVLFPGQYHDEETGLAYNFFRYYDPEDGRYISADPVRLEGALNTFAYVPNPLSFVDPLGLGHEVGNVSLTFRNGPTATPGAPHATHTSATTGEPTNFYSGYRARPGMPGREDSHCASRTSGQAYWESHTERKSMRWAEGEAARQGRSLRGAHLEMTGRWDPCNTCNAAMERWTQAPPDGKGASVTYNWPTNNSRTYRGGTSSGSPRTRYQ